MTVTNNTDQSRYELVEDGYVAYADYRVHGTTLSINYVFSPPELRGKGTAGRLMQGLMENAKAQSLKVTPICGYAASWLQRHPEFNDMKA
ncbi:MAG TPA: N-acetyltransferase [Rhodospirillaceae bacterium]|nr:N-acetyltransferase [Rhodospirillaceae bacterium]